MAAMPLEAARRRSMLGRQRGDFGSGGSRQRVRGFRAFRASGKRVPRSLESSHLPVTAVEIEAKEHRWKTQLNNRHAPTNSAEQCCQLTAFVLARNCLPVRRKTKPAFDNNGNITVVSFANVTKPIAF